MRSDSTQQFLVQLTNDGAAAIERDMQAHAIPGRLESIFPTRNYYRLILEDLRRAPDLTLDRWKKQGHLISWRQDRKVTLRKEPNDPLWPDQWDMQRIGMPQAWDISTGGTTIDGDTIVIAVLDDGYALDHPDLADAIWRNRAEIPQDGIDNDGNGYEDDYLGLYLQTGTDDHPPGLHGTAVAGIMGASGDNNEGICGVNWNVRIMLISGIDTETDVVEGFNYIRMMRARYNETGGEEGAFVVASNLSAGIDNAWAEDHPEWCAVYADVGNVGVLNVAATTNKNENVDEEGDMPSTCASDYLVMVTNTDIDDRKLLFAGFGPEHVDLGAPGTFTITTGLNGDYFNFESTSASAPHVTGAIGLMYSTPCTDFITSMREDPALAALQVKGALLQTVDLLPDLAGRTSTGGRLNVFAGMNAMNAFCGGSTGTLEILAAWPNPQRGNIRVRYETADLSEHAFRLVDVLGREVLVERVVPSPVGEKIYLLDTTNLPGGIYFLSLLKGDKRVTTRILVP